MSANIYLGQTVRKCYRLKNISECEYQQNYHAIIKA